MSELFKQGQKLKAIYWNESTGDVRATDDTDIEVIMENGQMAGVPWALVTDKKTGKQQKFNLALCDGVEL